MENFDNLVISLLDSNVMKGAFIKEVAGILNIPMSCICDVSLETELIEGMATQIIIIEVIDVEIKKENLMDLPFKSIYENTIRFEVGDIFL